MTIHYNDYETAAKEIIKHVGNTIVIGIPLGIGKPIGLINALYRIACENKSINLTILTALTLSRPHFSNLLEQRLVEPILDRLLKDYEDPLYEKARECQQLPENIKVIEFFLTEGKYLNNATVQQNFISTNYTNVIRDLAAYQPNVLAQLVAHSPQEPEYYSLSCNTDLFINLTRNLYEAQLQGKKIAIVAEVNQNLPYMLGEAVMDEEIFSHIIDTEHYPTLFAIPRPELSPQDHMIGLYTSMLVKDRSCLQIGIGKLGNALSNALLMRQNDNSLYGELISQLNIDNKFGETIHNIGAVEPFEHGLYASTEMLCEAYLPLLQNKILKQRVYDHAGLQHLLNINLITEKVTPDSLSILLKYQIIQDNLSQSNVNFLKHFGIFNSDINFKNGYLILANGETNIADLTQPFSRKWIEEHCLGQQLKNGKLIHAGFFLGSATFYQQLRDLSPAEMQQIEMSAIARTNALTWAPELLKLQRQQARFVNSTMMMTVAGAAISDGLNNLQEFSGIGGQFDFVNMAQSLENAHSILNCHSVRKTKQGMESNIRWDYGNQSIPRFLRDIVVTEYGIANIRGKTDEDVIKAMLNITDSRFQSSLLKTAKKYGKIANDYEIPANFTHNLPESYEPAIKALQAKGWCLPYPFGSDLTDDEIVLEHALLYLKNLPTYKLVFVTLKSLLFFSSDQKYHPYLMRMNLINPKTLTELIYKKILKYIIHSH